VKSLHFVPPLRADVTPLRNVAVEVSRADHRRSPALRTTALVDVSGIRLQPEFYSARPAGVPYRAVGLRAELL